MGVQGNMVTVSEGERAGGRGTEERLSPPPVISVIIPTYNAEKYLSLTLESVLAQTETDWALTVVDDGSSDDTCAIVGRFSERDPRIQLLRQANAGAVAARNRGVFGVDPATQYVILLDHDDVWEPDALRLLRAALEAHPDAVAAHGVTRSIDNAGHPTPSDLVTERTYSRSAVVDGRVVDWPLEGVTNFAALCVENWIITPGAVLICRAALQAVGPLDSTVYPCDDWDLWLRLSRQGDLLSLADPVLRYRIHDDNASHNLRRMGKGSLRFRRKTYFSKENTPQQKQVLRVSRRYVRAMQRRYFRSASVSIRQHVAKREMQQARQESVVLFKIFTRHVLGLD